jgi:hypothetical protein
MRLQGYPCNVKLDIAIGKYPGGYPNNVTVLAGNMVAQFFRTLCMMKKTDERELFIYGN